MKVVIFANRMPDLCGAFLHDIDLGTELVRRGHQVTFLTIKVPKEGYNGGVYRGFRFLHFMAGSSILDVSDVWITPHSPILTDVRKLNSRGYGRPIVATCHFDGNYNAVRDTLGRGWSEMLFFINNVMEGNYRKNIVPWPSQIKRTETIRPLLHRNRIEISEPFQGDCITLVNANNNKGVAQFLELAKKLPDRKFLGVIAYYGEIQVPIAPSNVEWIPFCDDIRDVLKRTRILLVPSYYESFGRIAVEAMLNGIPVLYSTPVRPSQYPGGSTEGLDEWIQPVGISCRRDHIDDWVSEIDALDDEVVYKERSDLSRQHIEALNIFTEASRICERVESFARENPIVLQQTQSQPQAITTAPTRLLEPPRSGALGFSNGRLRIQR